MGEDGQGDHRSGLNPTFPFVIMEVRLPRILAAAVVGGGLAVAGGRVSVHSSQSLGRPIYSGVSSGAAFGASLALVLGILGISVSSLVSVPVFAFAGAMATLAAVFALAAPDGRLSSNTLIPSRGDCGCYPFCRDRIYRSIWPTSRWV